MLNQILRKIKFFGQEITQQNKNCCHINRQVKLLATAVLVFASNASFAGKFDIAPDQSEEAIKLYNKGMDLAKLRKYEESISQYNKAISLNPDYAEIYNHKAESLSALGEYDEAVKSYNQALELDPTINNHDLNLVRNLMDAYNKVFAIESNDNAAVYSNKANLAQLETLQSSLNSNGNEHIASRVSEVAVIKPTALPRTKLRVIDSNDEATAIILASSMAPEADKVSMKLNGVPQGGTVPSTETLSRINSANQATAMYNLGQEQAESKQFEAAIHLFDESLLANPKYADAHHGKGYSLAQLKRHEEAIKSFDEALKYQSDFAMCHYNRACALQDLGRIEEARDGFKVAVGLNPEYHKQSRATKILQEAQDIAINEPMSGQLADATNSLDRTLEILHDYPSVRGNETRDLETQTTVSMLSGSAVSTQTAVQVKEAEVQVSSSMSSSSAQPDSTAISSTFVQTDSSAIGATEIATQTSIASNAQAVQTLPAKISSTFTKTEALESKTTGMQANSVAIGSTEKQVQTEANVINQDVQTEDITANKDYSEISTSTDDLFVFGTDDSHSDILDWEVASHASSESDASSGSDASSYSESVAEESIASSEIDEEEGQVLSELSQQILSKDNSDFYKTVAEIDELLASDLAEEGTHAVEANNNVELQRLQALEHEKAILASSFMELASHSTRDMTGSIISDIDKRLQSAVSLAVVSAGEEEEQLGSRLVGGSSGFYISPFIGKALQQERAGRSGYHSNNRGAIIGYDLRLSGSILLGFNFTKASLLQ